MAQLMISLFSLHPWLQHCWSVLLEIKHASHLSCSLASAVLQAGFSPAGRSLWWEPAQEFDSRLAQKKNSLAYPIFKAQLGARSFSHVTGHYVRAGQGFGGFFDLCEKVFFLIQCRGAVRSIFFKYRLKLVIPKLKFNLLEHLQQSLNN